MMNKEQMVKIDNLIECAVKRYNNFAEKEGDVYATLKTREWAAISMAEQMLEIMGYKLFIFFSEEECRKESQMIDGYDIQKM